MSFTSTFTFNSSVSAFNSSYVDFYASLYEEQEALNLESFTEEEISAISSSIEWSNEEVALLFPNVTVGDMLQLDEDDNLIFDGDKMALVEAPPEFSDEENLELDALFEEEEEFQWDESIDEEELLIADAAFAACEKLYEEEIDLSSCMTTVQQKPVVIEDIVDDVCSALREGMTDDLTLCMKTVKPNRTRLVKMTIFENDALAAV